MQATIEVSRPTKQEYSQWEALRKKYKSDDSYDRIDKQKIVSKIISARESFLSDKKGDITAYDLRHDQAAYQELSKFRFLAPDAYAEVSHSINNYTKEQVRTHVG